MKTIKNFIAFIMLAALMAVSCQEKEGPEANGAPSFPQLIENYNVQAGEVLTVTFTPNYDWKVSIPVEMRQWFWIVDGSFQVSELSGKASAQPIEVKIGVTDTQEFDKNYTCDVTLTMSGQSEIIAKYMLPAKERTLELSSEQLQSGVVALTWSEEDADFRALVQVVSNTEWTVKVPEWLNVNVPESTIGTIDLVFTAESMEAVTGKVVFESEDIVLKEIDFSAPSCNSFDLYTPQMSQGEFEYAEGGYLWNETAASSVELLWMGADFRMPINIDAKCNWTVEFPEWLQMELPDKTAGIITTTLLGVPSKYPLTTTKGMIVFKYGAEVLKEVEVTIPGCQDIMTLALSMGLTELDYNYLGNVNTSTGYVDSKAYATLLSVKDVRVFAVETTGGVAGSLDPEWFKYDISVWNPSTDASVIQEREITFSVTENPGDARSAVFFALPPTVKAEVADLFNEGAVVKSEYSQYAVCVAQSSMYYNDYISVKINASAEFEYTFAKAGAQKAQQLTAAFGQTEYVYSLTYTSPYCRDDAYMTLSEPFTSFKVFSSDDLTKDMSGDAGFWLSYVNGSDMNNYGVVDMYSNEMELPEESSVGYVVFYGEDNHVFAIVECISPVKEEEVVVLPEGTYDDGTGDFVIDTDEYFVDKTAAAAVGAKMVEVFGGKNVYELSKEEAYKGARIFKLTLPAETPVSLTLLGKSCRYFQVPQSLSEYINVNDVSYYETSGVLDAAIKTAVVSMVEHESEEGVVPFVKFHLNMGEINPFMVVYLSLK